MIINLTPFILADDNTPALNEGTIYFASSLKYKYQRNMQIIAYPIAGGIVSLLLSPTRIPDGNK